VLIGCAIIGETLKRLIFEHTTDCNLLVPDPTKGLNDNISIADVLFISIHIPTENNKRTLNRPIFIKTTLIPGTTDLLCEELTKTIFFMLEFLSERTIYDDFYSRP